MRSTACVILPSAAALFFSAGLLLDWFFFFNGDTRLRIIFQAPFLLQQCDG
jgi:hypothetical protein